MRRLVLLVALAAVGTPASSQQLGSRIKTYTPAEPRQNTRLSDEQNARATMNAYTACIVDRSRRAADRIVALAPGSAEEGEAIRRAAGSDCLGSGELRFDTALMRGGLFQAMYRKDFGAASASDLGNRAVVGYGFGQSPAPQTAQRRNLLAYADCVVRVDGVQSRALVLSTAASAKEAAAITGLQPALASCLRTGSTGRFSRTMLRGLVAETLYRLSRAPVAERIN